MCEMSGVVVGHQRDRGHYGGPERGGGARRRRRRRGGDSGDSGGRVRGWFVGARARTEAARATRGLLPCARASMRGGKSMSRGSIAPPDGDASIPRA